MASDTGLYERFFRDAPDAVLVVDADGMIVDANEQASTMFGYEPAELSGRQVEDLLPDRLRRVHQEHRAGFRAAPGPRSMGVGMDLSAKRRDGTEIPVDVSLSPVVSSEGPVVLTAVRDVTARREAELVARQWADMFERVEWGVVISSADGDRLERMNPAFARMHGYTVDELTDRPLLDVFAPEALGALTEELAIVEARGHHRFESVHIRRDGTTFPVEVDATVILDEDGRLLFRAAHVSDISERKQAEHALRRSEARFRGMFESAPFGMVLVDPELRILGANDALATMLGHDVDALVGKTLGELTPEEDVRRVDRLAAMLFAGDLDHFMVEKRLMSARGGVVWVELHVAPVEDDARTQAIVIVVETTGRKQLEADLAHRATHDPLTGLPNRTLLDDRLEVAQARAARAGEHFAVQFIDLNDFKELNDRFGHAAGDAALAEVARRLARDVRPTDTVARVGGDEFIVLCEGLGDDPDHARDVAAEVARRVLLGMQEDIEFDGGTTVVGAAIGVLVTQDAESSAVALIATADAAMYAAKANGQEVVFADGS
ncbi:MAG: PAS domain S-box protein [Acidimicrobiales bacterium]